MLSDSIILKHIARQPKRAAGFKQLVRELGLHGEERRELDSLLQKMVARGTLISVDSDRYALPRLRRTRIWLRGGSRCTATDLGLSFRTAKSLSLALKARLTGDIFIAPTSDWQCHAWGPGAGRHQQRASGWAGGGADCAAGDAGASDGGGDFSLRGPRWNYVTAHRRRLRRRL